MFLIAVIPTPPKVITVTTHSVLLEFQAASEPVSSYELEYAIQNQAPSLEEYERGASVTPSDDQLSYRVLQDDLVPGGHYRMRIVPHVSRDVKGMPSESVQVQIPKPGMK